MIRKARSSGSRRMVRGPPKRVLQGTRRRSNAGRPDSHHPGELPPALWQNQHDAVTMCAAYFTSRASGSALVQMPTGSGKTGVIATVASLRARERPVLVISPSTALTAQLQIDVKTKFWEKVNADHSWAPERAFLVLPSRVSPL